MEVLVGIIVVLVVALIGALYLMRGFAQGGRWRV